MSLFATICSLVMIGVLFYYSISMVQNQIRLGQVTPALRIPASVQGLSIPVGCVLITIRVVQAGYLEFKRLISPQNTSVKTEA
jgi:TRAP-type C4-dicarboxylate transport system permease small subunit